MLLVGDVRISRRLKRREERNDDDLGFNERFGFLSDRRCVSKEQHASRKGKYHRQALMRSLSMRFARWCRYIRVISLRGISLKRPNRITSYMNV